jgi:putative lipoic acid-binding regulatory protein
MMTTEEKKIWNFPCDFPIKIVGKASPEFESFALSTVHKHFPDLKENAIQCRPSKDGTYLSITAIVLATSKEQLDELYRELTANKLVLVAL